MFQFLLRCVSLLLRFVSFSFPSSNPRSLSKFFQIVYNSCYVVFPCSFDLFLFISSLKPSFSLKVFLNCLQFLLRCISLLFRFISFHFLPQALILSQRFLKLLTICVYIIVSLLSMHFCLSVSCFISFSFHFLLSSFLYISC